MENDQIRIVGGSNEKGTGIQGTVIELNDDYCFKILHLPFNLIDFYIEMLRLSPSLKRIIAPVFLQKNENGQIHGYSMKKVKVVDWSELLDTRICDLTLQYKEFLDDASLLSESSIKIVDMDMKNLLLSPNGIVAIDIDAYEYSPLNISTSKQDILKDNIQSVTSAISVATRDSIMFYGLEFKNIRAAQIQPIVDTIISDNTIELTLREYAKQLILESGENKRQI